MGSSLNCAIDSLIEKKINDFDSVDVAVRDLCKFSKYVGCRNDEIHQYCFQYDDLLETESYAARMDTYNNKFYNFYDKKVKKTPYRFNLLRMFKPGELLTSVANH